MKNSALLVIDVQQGAFDGVICPPIDHAPSLIAACNSLINAARKSATPVIFIQHCEPDGVFVQGTPQHAVAEALNPLEDEIYVLKRASSAFENTVLDATLKQLNAQRLFVCGLQSEHCVFNTCVAALNLGYAITLAEDGHHTWTNNDESAIAISSRINAVLHAQGATLSTTEQIAGVMQGA